MSEGDLTGPAQVMARAIESMADWYDIKQITGTTPKNFSTDTDYTKLAVKQFGNADTTDHVVKATTWAGSAIEILIPAGGVSGKLCRIKSADADTTVVKLLCFVQKIAE